MISVEEAVDRIRQNLPDRRTEVIDLETSTGRVLAQDVNAVETSPRFTNSAMDGFAVRFSDLNQLPVALSIVGESRAGVPFKGRVQNGQAVRISTGARLPEGADTVVPVEDCEVDQDRVTILSVKKQGANVRYQGEEIQTGQTLLKSGMVLFPEQLALLASQGITQVRVFARPRVTLLTTGTEVRPFREAIQDFEIRDSNQIMLKEAIKLAGAQLVAVGHLPDDFDQTVEALGKAAAESDVVLLAGGVSVGPHDHVKAAANANGFNEIFWKISQQPGKPFFFAKKENVLLFGLPGNPVSAFMGFVHYLFPALRYLQGFGFDWPKVEAVAAESLEIRKKRTQLMRVGLKREKGQRIFAPLPKQGSHMISSISQAAGYLVVNPGEKIEKNEKREVYLFPWRKDYGIC